MVGIIAVILVLGLLLLIEYFVVSYFIRFEYVVGRFMSEVPLLSQGDNVETYVRSFQNAVELSLLQGIYDIKNQGQNLWFDYGSTMPDETTIRNWIIGNTTVHVNEYLTDYSEFAQNNGKIDIPNPNVKPNTIKFPDLKWEDGSPPLIEGSVSIEFNEIDFKKEKDGLIFDRTFKPSGRVRTFFKGVWGFTNDLILNDKIGVKVREKINAEINTEDQCTVDNVKSKIRPVVEDDFKNNFNNNHADKNVQIALTVENYDVKPISVGGSFDHCQVTITVKVIMEVKDKTDDKKYKYPVFDGSKVVEDYLGLIYRIRTGNGFANTIPTQSCGSSCATSETPDCCCYDSGGGQYYWLISQCNPYQKVGPNICNSWTSCNDDCINKGYGGGTIKGDACCCLTTTISPNCKILLDKYSAAFGATCTDPRWIQNNNYVTDVVRDQKIDLRDGDLIGQNAGNDVWCLDKLNLPDSCLASTTTTTIPISSCTGTISSCATWQGDPDNCERCLCYYTSTCRDPGTRDCSQFSAQTECEYCGCNWVG